MRSFHAKIGTGEDSYCDTLGFTEAEVEVAFETLTGKDGVKFKLIVFCLLCVVGNENIFVQEL